MAVVYTVEQPITGLNFSVPDEAYPARAEYAITDNETECARYWLPCVDYPTVRTSLEFHLRAETGMQAVANGRFVGSEDHSDGTTTTTYVGKRAVGRVYQRSAAPSPTPNPVLIRALCPALIRALICALIRALIRALPTAP